MRKFWISVAVLAAFFMTGCAKIERADLAIDSGKDKAIELIERGVFQAHRQYDRLMRKHREDGQRLHRLGLVLGRVQK